MNETYVFDFYNLYLPKGRPYINKDMGIKITPLKLAEEFEQKRKNVTSPYRKGGWKTAKCYIKSSSEKKARQIAGWLEILYSFAQNRSIFFFGWYKYRKGKVYTALESKFIEPRDNNSPALIRGIKLTGHRYNKDISLFIDTALQTLNDSRENKLKEIMILIHSYLLSKSETVIELKFLIAWLGLEKLANTRYNIYKSKSKLFKKDELKRIKTKLNKTLDKLLKNDHRLNFVKQSVTRNFLYEHNTFQKIIFYIDTLDLGFEKKEVNKLIKVLVIIRGGLVHNLTSHIFKKDRTYLFKLQKILEQVTLRLLGINKTIESEFLFNQYVYPETE